MNISITATPTFHELAEKFKDIDLEGLIKDKVKDIATQLEDAAKSHAPVKTGELRDSILVLNTQPLGAVIQAQAGHAMFVHEGTRKMSARPFMELGANDVVKDLEKDLAKDIEDEIQNALR